jgi:hypothetical protein
MMVALAALLVALGGTAYASIPGSDGVVKACYGKDGALRVVDSSASCDVTETQLLLAGPTAIDLLRPYGAFSVAGGKVTVVDSAGISGVTRLGRGRFCVKPTAAFQEVTSVVSAAFDPVGAAVAYAKLGNPDCPTGSLEVITGVLVNGTFRLKDEGFYTDPTG